MKYRIELAATAKADIRGQAQWLRSRNYPGKKVSHPAHLTAARGL